MKNAFLTLTVVFTSILGYGGFVQAAGAGIYDGVNCKQATDSAVCNRGSSDNDPIAGQGGILLKATNIVAIVAGAAAVIIIIVSAIRFVTSAGEAGKVKKARDGILYSLIGIAVIILARSIILYVLNRIN